MAQKHVFTGFGFGPIQSGLFAAEAFKSKNFERIVIAEIDENLVNALRKSKGTYAVNIAAEDRIYTENIEGIEIYNPTDPADQAKLAQALQQSTEIVTSLPSVDFFDTGNQNSVASLIAKALSAENTKKTIIYTAENNNHAAQVLRKSVMQKTKLPTNRAQFLNTVIGKMSQVVTDPQRIQNENLTPITPDLKRAFLVEQFNKILVTTTTLSDFTPGIKVFQEKDDLLPFEEAKLYGHNAIHASLAYLGALKGYKMMTQLRNDDQLMAIAKKAFIQESGQALIKKHADLNDPLFTEKGYEQFAMDLLKRMTNPYLSDTIQRAGRDPVRKLSLDDRIFGTINVALQQNVEPENMTLGAAAGLDFLLNSDQKNQLPQNLKKNTVTEFSPELLTQLLKWLWKDSGGKFGPKIIELVDQAVPKIKQIKS